LPRPPFFCRPVSLTGWCYLWNEVGKYSEMRPFAPLRVTKSLNAVLGEAKNPGILWALVTKHY